MAGRSPGLRDMRSSSTIIRGPVPPRALPRRREIQRHHRNALLPDVEPHVEFGPIGQRKHPQALSPALAAVIETPGFGALALRIHAVLGVTKRKHPSLGPRAFFAPPRAAECSIESVEIERLPQGMRF